MAHFFDVVFMACGAAFFAAMLWLFAFIAFSF